MQSRDAAFTAFVTARQRALLRTAVLLCGNRAEGEDLLQSALATTYLAWPRLRDPQAAEVYVRRVLVTTHVSWWRSAWRRREQPVADVPESPGRDDDALERLVLWPHLRALPRRQRAVLVLRYYEDLSERDIADLLGCSPGTVKSHAARGLATLRARLDDSVHEPAGGGA